MRTNADNALTTSQHGAAASTATGSNDDVESPHNYVHVACGYLCGNQPVRAMRIGIATPSSRRRVDGVEDDATIQHERAVKFDFHTGPDQLPWPLPIQLEAWAV